MSPLYSSLFLFSYEFLCFEDILRNYQFPINRGCTEALHAEICMHLQSLLIRYSRTAPYGQLSMASSLSGV